MRVDEDSRNIHGKVTVAYNEGEKLLKRVKLMVACGAKETGKQAQEVFTWYEGYTEAFPELMKISKPFQKE